MKSRRLGMDNKEYFDGVAKKWDRMREGFFSEAVREKALAIAGVRSGRLAADIGAATGFITEGLIQKGIKVIAVDALTGCWSTPYGSYQEAVNDLSRRFTRETNVRYFLDSLVESVKGYDFLFSQYAMSAIDVYYQGWHHILRQIHCPVLLVRAKSSWYLPMADASKMKKSLQNCSYFEVSGSDHMVYVDNPDEFYPVFEEFATNR